MICGLGEHDDKVAFLKCLKVWKDTDVSEKDSWIKKMGSNVKVFIAKDDDNNVVGMIQIIPIEYSNCYGNNMAFIQCLLVNFYEEAFGNKQNQGYGKALLNSAIDYAKSLGADALVAWGTEYNGLETAQWYKRQGFESVDKLSYTELLWMPFKASEKPQFVKRKPIPIDEGKVTVSIFNNGWCTSRNYLCSQAKGVAKEYPDVVLNCYDTFDRETFLKHGIMEGIFVNEHEIIYYGTPIEIEMREKIEDLLDSSKSNL